MGDDYPLTGIILAGGEGARMGGNDKGWIELKGTALIERVVARITPQVSSCIISANRHLDRYRQLSVPVVSDPEVYLGPLAGIASALQHSPTEYALIVPTDAPLVPLDLATRLKQALPADLVICDDGERLQPLFGIYRRSLLPSIETFLQSGQRQLTRWCLAQNPKIVTIRDTLAFANLNTPDELENIQRYLDNPQA